MNPSRYWQSQRESGRAQGAAAALLPRLRQQQSSAPALGWLHGWTSTGCFSPPVLPSHPDTWRAGASHRELPAHCWISVWEGIEDTFNVHFIHLQKKSFFLQLLKCFLEMQSHIVKFSVNQRDTPNQEIQNTYSQIAQVYLPLLAIFPFENKIFNLCLLLLLFHMHSYTLPVFYEKFY